MSSAQAKLDGALHARCLAAASSSRRAGGSTSSSSSSHETSQKNTSSSSLFFRDVAASVLASWASRTVGYPLDTVKVRVQAPNSQYTGYKDCAGRMLREEGPRSFFKGLAAPLLLGSCEMSARFAAFSTSHKYFLAANNNVDTPLVHASAGVVSGFVQSHVTTPLELYKCRLQVAQLKSKDGAMVVGSNFSPCSHSLYSASNGEVKRKPIDVLRWVKSFYAGHTATLAREIPGNAAWFGFYKMTAPEVSTSSSSAVGLSQQLHIAAAGAGAGVAYWTAFFPADVVKTRMQTSKDYQSLGFWRSLSHVYRQEGLAALYRGYSMTAFRAIPVNAVTFSVYEVVCSLWKE